MGSDVAQPEHSAAEDHQGVIVQRPLRDRKHDRKDRDKRRVPLLSHPSTGTLSNTRGWTPLWHGVGRATVEGIPASACRPMHSMHSLPT